MSGDERLQAGTRVMARGEVWTVAANVAFSDCAALTLHGSGASNAGVIRTLLTPFDRVIRMEPGAGIRVLRPRRWLHALRRIGADAHPFGGLATAAASRIDILPYQLEPAMAVARGAARVMIADAVGLGKTVQAGLILKELAARGDTFRALVAAPAGLREQWARELAARFSLAAIVADTAWLGRMGRELPPDVHPWVLPAIYIASYDFLKRAEVLRPLEELTWDALVIDEAHNASPGTARRAALHAIALRARRVILLTATPHPGDAQQFDALCRIGEVDPAAERLTIFRRSRQDAGAARPRRSVLLPVRLSAAERRMHRLLDAYTARVCREASLRGDARARLAAVVLRKRALSSAASLAASTTRRIALLAGTALPVERQLSLPLADEDTLGDEEPDGILATPGLSDALQERRLLRGIASAAEAAARAESKPRVLLRLLARTREPAIIFTEYRDTLVRLHSILEAAGLRVESMHGGQSPAERAGVQRAFNESDALLLATDAAAEGLNLHTRCRMVIHYELPWSPSRIEQRTGRVDRIGQCRTVHEIVLVARNTAERLVLAPLARRAARVRSALHGTSRLLDLLTESRIAAAVMDGNPLGSALDIDPHDTPETHAPPADLRPAASVEAERTRMVRAWLDGSTKRRGFRLERRLLVSTVRPGERRGRTLIAVYRAALSTSSGQVVHSELLAVNDPEGRPLASRRALDLRYATNEWVHARERHARAVIASVISTRFEQIGANYRLSADALKARESAITRAIPSASKELVQAGLFDSRAVRAREARRRAARAVLADSASHLESLASARQLTLSLKVVAVLWRGHAP